MKSLRGMLLLMLMGVTIAWSADPNEVQGIKVPAEVQGEVGDLILIPATTDSKTVRWVSLDNRLKIFPMELLKDTKTAIVLSSTAGSYKLMAYTCDGGAPTLPVYSTVQVGISTPPPPGPPSGDKVTSAWILVVEDTEKASNDRGSYFTDKDLLEFSRSNPTWRFKVVDKDVKDFKTGETPKGLKPWIAKTSGKSLPQMFVIDQSGSVRYQDAVPPSPALMLDLLKKIKGN